MADWADRIGAIATDWVFGDVPDGALPDRLLLPMENPDLHDHKDVAGRLTDLTHYRSLSTGTAGSRRVGVMRAKLGAPAVAMVMEAAGRRGVREVLALGFTGGLQPAIECGDWIVPTGAAHEGGVVATMQGRTTVSEARGGADVKLVASVAAGARRTGHRVVSGMVVSTDCVFGESTAKVERFAADGHVGIDMESAAVFEVAAVHGMAVAVVLIASDNPIRGTETDFNRLVPSWRNALACLLTLPDRC